MYNKKLINKTSYNSYCVTKNNIEIDFSQYEMEEIINYYINKAAILDGELKKNKQIQNLRNKLKKQKKLEEKLLELQEENKNLKIQYEKLGFDAEKIKFSIVRVYNSKEATLEVFNKHRKNTTSNAEAIRRTAKEQKTSIKAVDNIVYPKKS